MNLEIGILIPVIVGLVEVVKRIGLANRFAAPLSLIFGIGGAFVFPATTIPLTVLTGIILGLSAAGLYAGTKATIKTEV